MIGNLSCFRYGHVLQTWSTGGSAGIASVSEGLVVKDKMFLGSFLNGYVAVTEYKKAK